MSGERIISGFDGGGSLNKVMQTFNTVHTNSHLLEINETGERAISLPSNLITTQEIVDLAIEDIPVEPVDPAVEQYIIDEVASPTENTSTGCTLEGEVHQENLKKVYRHKPIKREYPYSHFGGTLYIDYGKGSGCF